MSAQRQRSLAIAFRTGSPFVLSLLLLLGFALAGCATRIESNLPPEPPVAQAPGIHRDVKVHHDRTQEEENRSRPIKGQIDTLSDSPFTALPKKAVRWPDAEGERAALAQFAHELEALAPMIAVAERQAVSTARVRFRYRWLRDDLEAIRRGILEHLKAPREPRSFPPLRGDYRR